MVKKVEAYIKENALLKHGDRVLVALSGGADSVCLLQVLLELCAVYALDLAAVHVNHGLRGDEAERDAAFCASLCKEKGVKLHLHSVDVRGLAQKSKHSIETAAREVRYAIFNELQQKHGYTKVAVAHNAQDNAETVLMHLLRGSGLDGLRGILPQRGSIIRPLLCVDRVEIETYLSTRALTYVTDATNFQTEYARNRIRHDLLKHIQNEYNPNFVHTISESTYLLTKDAAYLNAQAEAATKLVVKKSDATICVDAVQYNTLPEAIALRVMKSAIAACLGKVQDIPFDTVIRAHKLCAENRVGKKAELPNRAVARMEHGRLVLGGKAQTEAYCYPLELNRVVHIPQAGISVTAKLTDAAYKNTKHTVYFDADKITAPLCVRSRRDGDRVSLIGLDGSKKLKDYFIDAKIPKHERDICPLVCSGDEILWICGKRKCAHCGIDKHTKTILMLTYEERKL